MDSAKSFNRLVKDKNTRDESKKTPGAQIYGVNVKQRQAYAHCRDRFYQRADCLHGFDHSHHVRELKLIAPDERFLLMLFPAE